MTAANDGDDRDLVADLRRWQDFGARWHVLARSASQVTVALYRCDDGEEVERLTSSDPRLLAFLDGRTSSDD